MFPRFNVIQSDSAGAFGTVAETHYGSQCWIADAFLGYLLSPAAVIFGRWHSKQDGFVFSPEDSNAIHQLVPGSEWEVLDGYWGERAEIVLDRYREWTRSRFRVAESQLRHRDGSTSRGIWDHEHCAVCWGTIDENCPDAYVNNLGEWVCAKCYEQFVAPRSLQFIPSAEE